MDSRTVFLVLIFVVQTYQKMDKNFGGPFDVICINKLEPCEELGTKELVFHSYDFKKISRTALSYTGQVDLGKPMDEKIVTKMEIDVWRNGEWKSHFQKQIKNPCPLGKETMPKYFSTLFAIANVTDCPIPAGTYLMNDTRIDTTLKMKELPYNKHNANVSYMYEEKKIGSLLFTLTSSLNQANID